MSDPNAITLPWVLLATEQAPSPIPAAHPLLRCLPFVVKFLSLLVWLWQQVLSWSLWSGTFQGGGILWVTGHYVFLALVQTLGAKCVSEFLGFQTGNTVHIPSVFYTPPHRPLGEHGARLPTLLCSGTRDFFLSGINKDQMESPVNSGQVLLASESWGFFSPFLEIFPL